MLHCEISIVGQLLLLGSGVASARTPATWLRLRDRLPPPRMRYDIGFISSAGERSFTVARQGSRTSTQTMHLERYGAIESTTRCEKLGLETRCHCVTALQRQARRWRVPDDACPC